MSAPSTLRPGSGLVDPPSSAGPERALPPSGPDLGSSIRPRSPRTCPRPSSARPCLSRARRSAASRRLQALRPTSARSQSRSVPLATNRLRRCLRRLASRVAPERRQERRPTSPPPSGPWAGALDAAYFMRPVANQTPNRQYIAYQRRQPRSPPLGASVAARERGCIDPPSLPPRSA